MMKYRMPKRITKSMTGSKKIFVYLLYLSVTVLTIAVVSGCDLGFLTSDSEDGDSDGGCANYSVWNDDGTLREVYDCNDTLLYYEEYDKDSSGKTVETRHFDGRSETLLWTEGYEYDDSGARILLRRYAGADRVLLYSYVYSRTEDGDLEIEAYYDENDELVWFRHSIYEEAEAADESETEYLLVMKIHYDAEWLPLWVEEYAWEAGQKVIATRHDDTFTLQWGHVYTFDEQGRALREYGYGVGDAPVTLTAEVGAKPDQSSAEAPNSAGLTVPIPPAAPELPEFDPDPVESDYMYLWTYDDYGNFRVDFNAYHLPDRMVRTDSRLPEGVDDVTVSLEYYPEDDASVYSLFPMRKTAFWGDTELLALDLTYNDDGFLSRIDLSSEQAEVPEGYFELAYNEDRSLDRIDLGLADTLIYYFEFDAEPSEPGAAHPLDPTGFTGQVYSIEQYSADAALVGTFSFEYDDENSQVRIDATRAPDTEGVAGVSNGHFLLGYDEDGQAVSFESFTPEGEREWYYTYGYADVLGQAVRISEEKYDEFADEIAMFDDLRGNPLELFF